MAIGAPLQVRRCVIAILDQSFDANIVIVYIVLVGVTTAR